MGLMRKFLSLFTNAGFLLVFAGIAALFLANFAPIPYFNFLEFTPRLAVFGKQLSVQLWINDLLMAGFFLLAGLEIKREIMQGELKSRAKASLPVIAAIGGMIVPAAIYLIVTWHSREFWNGWAIASATDIAFSLAVLSLLGSRVPVSLKIFLTALAIIDDLGAILIIALFYSGALNMAALAAMAACVSVLWILNRRNVQNIAVYLTVGLCLWIATLLSGIHATLAGVVLAAFIPGGKKLFGQSPLEKLEHGLHPYVAYCILPLFALANAGLDISGIALDHLLHPITIGIIAGLAIGKPAGIFGGTYLFLRGQSARLPKHCNWTHILGVGALGGVGFTMSLFIGNLAFTDIELQNEVKLGVLTGSVLSALLGYGILRIAPKSR